MEKILVTVRVPALDASYDVFISPLSPMYEVQELLKKAMTALSHGQYTAGSDSILCFGHDGNIININLSVKELGLRNGSRLMLI